MARLAIVQSFERATEDGGAPKGDVKCDPGGGANVTAAYVAASGVDAPPLPGDTAVLDSAAGSGRELAIGYQDPKNAGKAEPGEHRIYARDPEGNVVAEFHVKGAGSLRLENPKGFIDLGSDGVVNINGCKFSTSGAVSSPGEVTAMATGAGVKLSTHLHPTAMGPSGAPTPGT